MECHSLTFYGKEIRYSTLFEYLKNVEKPFRVVTNNLEVHNHLSKNEIYSLNLAEVFPEEGPLAKETYHKAKKILEQYIEFFDGIKYNGINVFKGFEFLLLLQLFSIVKAKTLLEKPLSTVFVIERYSPVFFAIQKIAQELGYKSELKVGFIRNKKIIFLKNDGINDKKNLEFNAKIRTINFVKNIFGGSFSWRNLNILLKFLIRFLSLRMKKSSIRMKNFDITVKKILKKIDKKIENTSAKNNAICILFLTASRLDIYLRPIQPVLKKLDLQKIPYHIVTTDISTSMMLSKNDEVFLSFFEEIDILYNAIMRNMDGIHIKNELEHRMQEHGEIIGLKELFPDLLYKVYRSMAITILLEHIFKKMKIKTIVDSGTAEMLEYVAIEMAEKNNVVSYCIVPSPLAPYPIFVDAFHAKKIFVEGNQGLEVLQTLGYAINRILVVGGPRYDKFKNLNSRESKIDLEKKFQIDSTKKLVVLAMSRWHEDDEKWISDFIDFCNKKNYEVVIKIHPTYKVASQNLSENKIKAIKDKCKNLKFIITYEMDIPTLFSASDIVLTDWSSVGIEAILLDKPLIQVNFTNEEIEHNVRYFDYNASILIKNYNELEKTINEILIQSLHLEKLKNGRETMIEKYNYLNDGKASDRIFEILSNHNM